MQPEISVVIPVYCEAAGIRVTLREVEKYLSQCASTWEIVVVDDGSKDSTWDEITTLSAGMPGLRGLRLSRNFGKEAAVSAGLAAARGRAVVLMDGDMQHPPSLLPTLVQTWRTGEADIVEAVKSSRGNESAMSAARAKLFYLILRAFSGHDLNGASDYKLLDQRVVEAYRTMKERNVFFRGMVSWMGFRTTQIPFQVEPRIAGDSGWSVFGLVRLAAVAVTSFSTFPLHLITIFGLVFFAFSVLLGVHTVYMKLSGAAITGFTTVILLLLIIGSSLMIGLGIIGEYLARIYEEVKQRPRYIVSQELPGPRR
ncbi:MAG: glycosyltransferase family 2 protein [Acidovorax sp.]|uniref:glycosyltransferase family 2 protein n=1 Tax=Acidovorax sp. TaxID=1872122 RepID=UPI0025BEF27A|nr:glycosyltransferase family 2 protein [Acidovorax sp.]MCE1191901.1 glycosyltransferase family 2 protein [Acidovorax sp.]